ncbi:hypothetical protein IAQ67_29050 (plasmid) [Paenibacillus peoriae]|uniref:Uncharacterized protein n=1 Tax=Paenibacillus peoriae TaxID=59893 RepID=A0A7H0YH45_9BACL|nr:hypothetical protein [Paenibacillus peoriae]QNR70403.1 hypothetical protein IAQ67_29050 [Paenibacillus peoriae]
MNKRFTFWNDDDGFSAKDFLMVLFCVLFAVFLIVAFIVSLVTGTLPAATITVIGMMDIVVPTIVGGVFGVQAVREFRRNKDTQDTATQTTIQDQPTSYTGTVNTTTASSTNDTVNFP